MKRILIANRGEIAARIAKTCHRLGIEYATVHSEEDIGAEFCAGAVSAHLIGGPSPHESYSNADAIIDAALDAGADAIHPGYGFLSEDAVFARAVIERGLTFIGPRPEVIATMGDKSAARNTLSALGIPVLPGSTEPSNTAHRLQADIDRIGLPVVLKPIAGGGGRGIVAVHSPEEIDAAIATALRAGRAIGNDLLIVEKLVERPRHIEVQVFGDELGTVVHLFDRECSAQRLRQKVVEEAPAPALPERLRRSLLAAAVAGARGLGYTNAGTFEFLVGPDGDYFLIEVNTRLQVEHTVTEEITGIDLVEWQIRVAAGEPIPVQQDRILAHGAAIQLRLCAEDPTRDFAPVPGSIDALRWPEHSRVDRGFDRRGHASAFYDSLIAKIVSAAPTRALAISSALEALDQLALFGVGTNEGLLRSVLTSDEFRYAAYDTDLIRRCVVRPVDAVAIAAIAAAVSIATTGAAPTSPWSGVFGTLHRSDLSIGGVGRVPIVVDGTIGFDVAVSQLRIERSHTTVELLIDGLRFTVATRTTPGYLSGTVSGFGWRARIDNCGIEILVEGQRHRAERGVRRAGPSGGVDPEIRTFMPGRITAVPVAAGDQVAAGDVLCIVEAMKMENHVTAPCDGVITMLACAPGEVVAARQLLFRIESGDDGDR